MTDTQDTTPTNDSYVEDTFEDSFAEPNDDGANTDASETAEQSETELQPQEAEEQTQEPPRVSRAEQRIHEKHAEVMHWRQKFEELEAKHAQDNQQPVIDGQPPKEPSIDDYNDENIEQYFADHNKWMQENAKFEAMQEIRQQEQQQAEQQRLFDQQKRVSELETAMENAIQVDPEIQKSIGDAFARNEHSPINVDFTSLPLSPDLTVKIFDHIGKDADLHLKLASMNPPEAIWEIGKLAGRLEAQPTKQAPTVTKAPKPPTHTKSNSPASRSTADMSDDEFLESAGYQ